MDSNNLDRILSINCQLSTINIISVQAIKFVVRTLVLHRRKTKVLTTNHFYDGYLTGCDITVNCQLFNTVHI
jgi:hypothetical protein